MERNYDFRKRLLQIHEKNIRNVKRVASNEEYMLPNTVTIGIKGIFSDVTETAVRDFIDFLQTSMNISARMTLDDEECNITIALAEELGKDLGEAASYKGFMIDTSENGIVVCGYDERGIGQALYYIENLMTFEKAPVLAYGSIKKKPMFAPRMIHSAYGVDEYPDEYLARIAHEGRDVILVFTKGVDKVPHGYLDFNELIDRARRYGLDVYAYSFIKSDMSPEAPGAEAYYENTYGKLFRECPGLGGVTLVGESVEFPSRDPHVAPGKYYETVVDGIPIGKPSSGWYPCEDYPIWLNLIKKIIRKYNKNADIVFWSYNWGEQPEEARVRLIESLPTDISLQATFEMCEPRCYENIIGMCDDYTLAFEGPGKYFESEAIAAKKRGIRLYSMTNTGGLTWDIGVIPYEPMPYQWMKRYKAMINANRNWGLVGLMESHHFGFTPSFISKLSNLAFLEPLEPMEVFLEKILKSEFGENNYEKVDKALNYWSDAIRVYTPSDECQYGSFRVGPSYPFNLYSVPNVPTDEKAMFGNVIINPDIGRINRVKLEKGAPYQIRIHAEIGSLERMLDFMQKGVKLLEDTEEKNAKLSELINLGKFIVNTVITGINHKHWQMLKFKLFASEKKNEISLLLDKMEELLAREIENVKATIPLVETDSRLGWEPSMEYVTDRWHLEWKLRQIQYVLDNEISTTRKSLDFVK